MGIRKQLRKEAKRLLRENDEYHQIMMQQAAILIRVANALNGPPPPRTMWSHHDLGEKAEQLVAKLPVVHHPRNADTVTPEGLHHLQNCDGKCDLYVTAPFSEGQE